MQDTQYTKDLEAACDCTIKWQEVSDNAWGQQKSAKMAAGEFPDIGLSLFSMVDAAKYSTYFEDLKPHLDKMPERQGVPQGRAERREVRDRRNQNRHAAV